MASSYQRKRLDQVETRETELGTMRAVKAFSGQPWRISHPWGGNEFYGCARKLRAELKKIEHKHTTKEG